ncbi:MAG: hypothetical protein ABRQ39_19930 [Candidatus Eremiobacterota bacterium]
MDIINKSFNTTGIGGNMTVSTGIKEVMTHKPDIQEIQAEAPQGELYVTGQNGSSVKNNLINLENNAKNITGEITQADIHYPFGHDNEYTRYVTGPDGVRHKEIRVLTGWGKDSWVPARDDQPQQEQTQHTQTQHTQEAVNADEAVVDASTLKQRNEIIKDLNAASQNIQDQMEEILKTSEKAAENMQRALGTMPNI